MSNNNIKKIVNASRYVLPYPANYLYLEHPAATYIIMKIIYPDICKEIK